MNEAVRASIIVRFASVVYGGHRVLGARDQATYPSQGPMAWRPPDNQG